MTRWAPWLISVLLAGALFYSLLLLFGSIDGMREAKSDGIAWANMHTLHILPGALEAIREGRTEQGLHDLDLLLRIATNQVDSPGRDLSPYEQEIVAGARSYLKESAAQ